MTPQLPLSRIRAGEAVTGYFCMASEPIALERLARCGFDFVVVDGQHGVHHPGRWATDMMAIEAGGSWGMIRVPANRADVIGQALDAGAAGVVVPLVDGPQDAAAAVAAARFPPAGVRSRGTSRSALLTTGSLDAIDASVGVLAMVETRAALDSIDEIVATPGLDGIYIGPTDLTIGLGGRALGDPATADAFEAALTRIRQAAVSAGKGVVLHVHGGQLAARRRSEGFTSVVLATDMGHFESAVKCQLRDARGLPG